PVLDTRKFEQWQFQIQQYLQHEHYALWEVIEFSDSYKVPATVDPNDMNTTSGADAKARRTVTITTEDMQRKKNDVKERTNLLLSLSDEHQLRFSKYKTVKELWAVILKTFGGNEATKKRKKNLLKQQYGNFKAEGSKTLEQTTTFPTASDSVATISQDTASAYIASQFSGSQIKFEDINQIDKDYMEEMDIKWSTTLYMANEGEDHALVADAEAPTEFALMANTESKVFDNSLCSKDCKKNNDSLNSKIKDLTDEVFEANNYIYHYKLAVAQLEGRLVEYKEREVKYIEKIRTLEMYREANLKCIETLGKELENLKLEKEGVDGKLAGLLKASKNLDNLIESQRPSPTVASTSAEGQNKNSTTSEDVASPNTPKPFVKFVKPKDSQSESETNKQETLKKPQVKYAEQYRHSMRKPNVKGNLRNWNNLKSYQLGPEFVLKKKACFRCGDFSHLANDCRKMVQMETTRPHGPSMNPMRPNMNGARPNRSFFIQAHSYETKPFLKISAVKTQYRAPWVPTVNRNNPPVNRKFSTGRKNFPTANRKFSTASKKFPTCSTKNHTADMGRKGKDVKPLACWIWKPTQNLSNKVPRTTLMIKAIGTVGALGT
nr:hypothetical protein [Tanacetum cinerariifolium]